MIPVRVSHLANRQNLWYDTEKTTSQEDTVKHTQRIGWIDVAKGIAMIAVFAGHLGQTSINAVVYAFHLPIFFILSGYTLKADLDSDSLSRRFRGLMVPYFITCAAILGMDLVNMIFYDGQTSYQAITARICMDLLRAFMASGTIDTFGTTQIGEIIGAIWFLPAMFFATVTAQLMLKIRDRRYRYITSLCLALLAHISSKYLWLPFSIQSGVFCAPLLLLGYDLRRSDILEKIRLPHFLVSLAVFVAGAVAGQTKIYLVTTTVPDLIVSAVCSLAACLCVYYIAKKLERSRVLAWIGRNSIYFLCIHTFDINTMGRYFRSFTALLGLRYTPGIKFTLRLIFSSAVTASILWIRKRLPKRQSAPAPQRRDPALDIAKAVLIALMLLGHFPLDESLRTVIYSFHMAAFVFYSGYCFRSQPDRDLKASIAKQLRGFLIPYALFGVAHILLTHQGLTTELRQLLLGMSFSKKLFPQVASIGPVYFILLLLVTKVVYLFIHRYIRDERLRALTVLGLSLLGVGLGRLGLWLPWSMDCALYCLIFYYLGWCFQRYGIMEFFCRRSFSYFPLSCIWVYMILRGGMEIATRDYGSYGVAVLGAVSACVLLYMLCRWLCDTWHHRLVGLLQTIGQQTLYILIVHRLFNRYLARLFSLELSKTDIWYIAAMVLSQILLGTLLGLLVTKIQSLRKER